MWDHLGELAQVIIAVTSLLAVILGYLNNRKIEAVHKATNGLTDKLVASERKDAHAEGVQQGKEEEREGKS